LLPACHCASSRTPLLQDARTSPVRQCVCTKCRSGPWRLDQWPPHAFPVRFLTRLLSSTMLMLATIWRESPSFVVEPYFVVELSIFSGPLFPTDESARSWSTISCTTAFSFARSLSSCCCSRARSDSSARRLALLLLLLLLKSCSSHNKPPGRACVSANCQRGRKPPCM